LFPVWLAAFGVPRMFMFFVVRLVCRLIA